MKKICKALALTLCMVMFLSVVTVAGDSGVKTILTLEEAKALALENDVQYKLQQNYINQKKEDYTIMSDNFNANRGVKASTAAGKAEGRINNQVALETANYAVKQEIFNKNDLKRASDYNVTMAYYEVMKAKYALDNAQRAMELAQKDLEIAKIYFDIGEYTKNNLSQAENAYKSAKTEYDAAFSSLEDKMKTLSKEIGKELDVNNDDIDMTIRIPDISAIDLDKIKEDNLNNNPAFFSAKKAVDLAKYKQFLVNSEYDDNYDKMKRMTDTARNEFDKMLYDANRDYENAQYQYDEAVKELDISLKMQYSGIITLMETIENLKKSVANMETTVKNDRLKHTLNLLAPIELSKSESALKDLKNTQNTAIVNLNAQYMALTQYSYTQSTK
jgi:outer membrane protein TolC